VDLWTANHVLSGLVLSLAAYVLTVSFERALIIASVLFVGWEVGERIAGVGERMTNQFADIATGYLGFFLGWPIASGYQDVLITLLVVFSLVLVLLTILGHWAWRKRTARST
jgi:hypothetical protein